MLLEKTPARPSASLCPRGIGQLQVSRSRVPRESEATPSANLALLGSDASRSCRKSWPEVPSPPCLLHARERVRLTQVRALTCSAWCKGAFSRCFCALLLRAACALLLRAACALRGPVVARTFARSRQAQWWLCAFFCALATGPVVALRFHKGRCRGCAR